MKITAILAVLVLAAALAGCSYTVGTSKKAQVGTGIGGFAGAIVGAGVGGPVGAGVGALVGGGIGNYAGEKCTADPKCPL